MNLEDYKIAYENVMIANKMLEKENKRLHSIIKEVKEYLELFDDNSSLIDHSIIKGALNILKGSE